MCVVSGRLVHMILVPSVLSKIWLSMLVPSSLSRRLLLRSERLCHVEFQESPEDAQNWLVVQPMLRTRAIKCGFLGVCMRVPRCPLSSHPKLCTQGKRRFFDMFCSYSASCDFHKPCSFVKTSLGVLIHLFSSVVNPHRCSVANMA